jgi:hypothetical protein
MNDIAFAPALRTDTAIILALAGPSGSGKTKSALELAAGLARPEGKILVIDTEGRRALHYADDYQFFHCEWRPPFSPAALGDLLKAAEGRGFSVIIVDSMSDEHEGEGGLCDMAEVELAKQRGENKNSAAAWARPKAEHKARIVRWLRQTRCHVIFCLRADEKVRFEKIMKDGRERTVIVPIGWQPIAEKRLLYDVTTSLLFTPDRPGYPQPIKLYDKHRRFFPSDKLVSREAGQLLREWAAGGVPEKRIEPTLSERARDAAVRGKDALSDFWKGLDQPSRHEIKDLVYGELAQVASRVDEGHAPLPDDPFGLPPVIAEMGQDHSDDHRNRAGEGNRQPQQKGGPPLAFPQATPPRADVREIEPSKVRGAYDWRSWCDSVLAEFRDVAPDRRQAFRNAQAQYMALLRSADRPLWEDLVMRMADVERLGGHADQT